MNKHEIHYTQVISVSESHVLKYSILYLSKEIINDAAIKNWADFVTGQAVAVWCSLALSKPVPEEKPAYQIQAKYQYTSYSMALQS